MCKQTKSGSPVFENNAGTFCQTCRDEMKRRSVAAVLKKRENFDGKCMYCGGTIDEKHPSSEMLYGAGGYRSHCECDTKRDWVLRCIRHSDKIAKYVEKTEKKEKPLREARLREAELKSQESAKLRKTGNSKCEDSPDERIARLEKMIENLTNALGGI